MPPLPQKRRPFLSFLIEPDLLEQIDAFRFAGHYPHRTEAILHLLRVGLVCQEAMATSVRHADPYLREALALADETPA